MPEDGLIEDGQEPSKSKDSGKGIVSLRLFVCVCFIVDVNREPALTYTPFIYDDPGVVWYSLGSDSENAAERDSADDEFSSAASSDDGISMADGGGEHISLILCFFSTRYYYYYYFRQYDNCPSQ